MMKLASTAFQEGGIIPSVYTCEGKNINPPLEISGAPSNAKSLVLIMDDPDVPAFVRPERMYDHWVVFNIPPPPIKSPNTPSLPESKGATPPVPTSTPALAHPTGNTATSSNSTPSTPPSTYIQEPPKKK